MPPQSWDIFCRVIDNFGDIGVSWRLARQLAQEQRVPVHLWIDDLQRLHAICPDVDPGGKQQHVSGVEIWCWDTLFSNVEPAQVVVEMFGCGLPDSFIEAMARRHPPSLWVVLEYLSAESWVPSHHGLPSPHPRWPIPRFFFFPGFVSGTGGLLRESDLLARRDAFGVEKRALFWKALGFEPSAPGATTVSLFAYESAPLESLIDAWASGPIPIVAAIPEGGLAVRLRALMGISTERIANCGNLELRLLPFSPQAQYDELLWVCDINFVRGEDSFVRAQWAARPFVWHVYPQQEQAHWAKLNAFLDRYCEGMPQATALSVREFWLSWNSVGGAQQPAVAWASYRAHYEAITAHTRAWTHSLTPIGDLAGNLAVFCENKI